MREERVDGGGALDEKSPVEGGVVRAVRVELEGGRERRQRERRERSLG